MTTTHDDSEPGGLRDEFKALGRPVPAIDATRMLESLSARLFDQGRTVTVGRFELRGRLGAGGMGVVMSGFDPQLQRTVALKVLHSAGDSQEQARLLDEARAMAKVRHPNLVTVFEAGTHEGCVYIAMEFVEGGTLGAWLEAESRAWQAVVPVFIGVANGLAAIHDAGLVHRDLKPENVLMGADDRPQVSDFGLVRSQSSALAPGGVEVTEDCDPVATQTLGMAGTPNYFAPEQWEGGRANAATDQWSFCVTLYEALYGQRPFAGDGKGALSMAVLCGTRTPLPASAPTLPSWLVKVVDRGLSCKPADRFASVHELVSALLAGTQRARAQGVRAPAIAAVAAAVAAGVGVFAMTEKPCDDLDARLEAVWTPQRAAAIGARFAAVPQGGASTWKTIEETLDLRVERWTARRRDACEATHVRGEQSQDALDLRMRCLERRAVEIESLLEIYDDVEEVGVLRALKPFETLGELGVCDDLEFLQLARPTPESADAREAVATLRERAARINASDRGDDLDAVRLAAIRLVSDAEGVGYEPVLAEAKLARAKVESLLGHGRVAVQFYEEAFEHALATHHLEAQVLAAVTLSFVYASQILDVEEAEQWGRQADALLRAHPIPQARRDLLVNRGLTALRGKDLKRARGFLEEARQLMREAGFEDSKSALDVEANLGILERGAGNFELALTRLTSAREKARRLLGDVHPMVGTLGNSLAMTLIKLERFDEAEQEYREGILVLETQLGQDAAPLGHPLNNLGNMLVQQERHAEALPFLERAIAVWTHHHGREEPLLRNPLWSRGKALLALERHAEASVDLERALKLLPKPRDPDDEASLLFLLVQSYEPSDMTRAKALAARGAGLKLTDKELIEEFRVWRQAHP